MRATILNANIRGAEAKSNKNGDPYILVRFEDATGKPCDVCDKDMSRLPYYQRDAVGDLHLNIEVGKFTTIRVVDFTLKR